MMKKKRRNVSHLLKLVRHLYSRRLRTLNDKDGIYPGQPPVLFCLKDNDNMNQRELAGALDQTPASMTVTLGRMEKAGLISRTQDPDDKRVQRVRMTEKGELMRKKAFETESIIDQEMLEGFSDEDIATLNSLLSRCAVNISKVSHPKKGEVLFKEFFRHVGYAPDELPPANEEK